MPTDVKELKIYWPNKMLTVLLLHLVKKVLESEKISERTFIYLLSVLL